MKPGSRGARWIGTVVIAAALLSAPLAVRNLYFLEVFNRLWVYVILAVSLDLVIGHAGLFSFAHGGLYAVGAYTAGLLVAASHWPLPAAMAAAVLVTAVVALAMGVPALRFRGPYLAIVTLAMGEIVLKVLVHWREVTGGNDGFRVLPVGPKAALLGLEVSRLGLWYYILLGLAAATTAGVLAIARSRFGRRLLALREDDVFAEFLGIHSGQHKLWAFVIGGALVGLAGAAHAGYHGFVAPASFGIARTVDIYLMVIIGGMGTIWGSVLGAALVVALPEWLRYTDEYRLVAYGLLLVMMILYVPEGIWGLIEKRLATRLGPRRPGSSAKW